jgi:G3E family GTPase
MAIKGEMPVYLFTGFLESGKTTFLEETLGDPRFNNGQRTLILLCEEGEAEITLDRPYMKNIFVETIDDMDMLTEDVLQQFEKKHKPSRILIEYNGMWPMQNLFDNMPPSWVIYQEFMFADATTFLTYNANMRSLVVDKLMGCELVVFNRFTADMDQMAFHKIVRGISRRPDIAYEFTDGKVVYEA